MPQLELFSAKIENEAVEKQLAKQHAITSPDVAEDESEAVNKSSVALAEETLLNRLLATQPGKETLNSDKQLTNTSGDVVFADEKIGVKIKKKKMIEPVEKKPSAKTIKMPQKRGRKSLKDIEGEVDLIEVPEDEELFRKQYYPISEVAKWFNVNTSLIRFWENEFDILKPRKNRKGDRLFRPEDIKNIHLIYHLLRQRKYSIEGAKEFLKGDKGQANIQLQLTQSLQKFKSFLLELKANLQ